MLILKASNAFLVEKNSTLEGIYSDTKRDMIQLSRNSNATFVTVVFLTNGKNFLTLILRMFMIMSYTNVNCARNNSNQRVP